MNQEKRLLLPTFSYACGLGAGDPGCADGPNALHAAFGNKILGDHYQLDWQPFVSPAHHSMEDKYALFAELNTAHAQAILRVLQQRQRFLSLGGDQTGTLGTLTAASLALEAKGPLGVIWIDAHLDAHTPHTSISGNVHGMPLAALLGFGEPRLTNILNNAPKLFPPHIAMIGGRSYETGELTLLQRLNVRLFLMEEVSRRGLTSVLEESFTIATQGTRGYCLTVDLDGLIRKICPALGRLNPRVYLKKNSYLLLNQNN